MSEPAPPEPNPPEPPRRDRRIVWPAIGSATLHAGLLVFLLWQPPPDIAQAAPPPAIEVELLPPPEASSAPEPTVEEPGDQASEAAPPPAETTPEEPSPAETAPTEQPPAEASPAEPPQPEQAAAPSATETSGAGTPSETAEPDTASEAATASEPVRALEAPAEAAPIPLTRPEHLTTPGSVSDEADAADTADTGAEGTAPSTPSEQPDVATLELGALHTAEQFYLKEMLSVPSMARAREMLETLSPEKRLLQTCNIEALAQIGNAGEGFEPDVVMAEAYARLETTGTRVAASGAIFRSAEKWYGLAFDCTLSDDLSQVTAFSYRLGTDVTEAVVARLRKS